MINVNKDNQVNARELHDLVVKQAKGGQKGEMFTHWIKRMLDYVDDDEYTIIEYDYTGAKISKSDNQRVSKRDYMLTLDCAKSIAMLQKNDIGKRVRNYLRSLDNQKDKGLLLSHEQIKFLTQIVPLFFYDVPRKIAKDRHFRAYNDKYTFHKYRAEILGYSKSTLINAMAEIGERYKSEEKALMKLDKHELIRRGVIDLMMALGKDKEHALNVGSIAKDIAKEMNLTFGGWNDRLFKIPDNLRDRIELVLQ